MIMKRSSAYARRGARSSMSGFRGSDIISCGYGVVDDNGDSAGEKRKQRSRVHLSIPRAEGWSGIAVIQWIDLHFQHLASCGKCESVSKQESTKFGELEKKLRRGSAEPYMRDKNEGKCRGG